MDRFNSSVKGKRKESHSRYEFPPELDVWHSPDHWSNQELTKHFVAKVIVPYVSQVCQEKSLPEDARALVIFCFSGHSDPVLEVLKVIILSMVMSLRSPLTDCNLLTCQ